MLQKKKNLFFRKQINKLRLKQKKIAIPDFGCDKANDCEKFLLNKIDVYCGFDIHNSSIKSPL
mgnify:CR=1 FL=1